MRVLLLVLCLVSPASAQTILQKCDLVANKFVLMAKTNGTDNRVGIVWPTIQTLPEGVEWADVVRTEAEYGKLRKFVMQKMTIAYLEERTWDNMLERLHSDVYKRCLRVDLYTVLPFEQPSGC